MFVKIMIDLNPIHDKLMRRVCPEHQLPPKIRMLRDRLDIKCCCESFRKEVLLESELLIYKAIEADMQKELRRILK